MIGAVVYDSEWFDAPEKKQAFHYFGRNSISNFFYIHRHNVY